MKALVCLAVGLAIAPAAFPQNRGGGGSVSASGNWVAQPRYNNGFGSVLYPGTGRPPAGGSSVTFPFLTNTQIQQRQRDMQRPHRGHSGAYPVFFSVPVYAGAEEYTDPQQTQPQTPNITIVMPPQQQQAVAPAPAPTQESSPGGAITYYRPPEEPSQVLFFIALKDAAVYTASAYWVEDGTLHYITPQGKHNQVSLALVDRETSTRLNEGRKVEFHLPAAR